MLPVYCFGAWKLVFWASNSVAAWELVNSISGSFSSAWGHLAVAMTVFPPYNDRSGDDLSVGGGSCPSRCLER